MALIGKSLDAATATGAGFAIMFDEPKANYSLFASWTGSPSSVTIHVEGTIDGDNWFNVDQVSTSATPQILKGGPFPVIGLRANLTALSGGTSPTVTAWVAAA